MAEPSLWQRFVDVLPWSAERRRVEREAALHELDDRPPAPKAGSAAEAMAAMKEESRQRNASAEVASEPGESGEEGPENTALRDKFKQTARSAASQADKDDLRRKRGG